MRTGKPPKTCFMCHSLATTRDHIPPQCLFPEKKDLPQGIDFRKNLITIPACDTHNLKTSNDDEYLMGILALHWQNNPAGENHLTTKVRRALKYNQRYHQLFFREGEHEEVIVDNQKLVTGLIDNDRFKAIMTKIVRGTYFHQFKEKWLGEVEIIPLSNTVFSRSNPSHAEMVQAIISLRRLCILQYRHGSNPHIFYYQIIREQSGAIMRLVFYDGVEIIASLPHTTHNTN